MPDSAAAIALSIVIPTWNGRDLLERYLPSVTGELERWEAAGGGRGELVVSDDGSTDGTAGWLAAQWPLARVTRSARNRGFAPAVNAGVAAAGGALVLLLNNDLELLPGALAPLPERFAAEADLFGLTLRAQHPASGNFETGGKCGRFRRGFWQCWRNFDCPPGQACGESFTLVGGFCVFRRDLFLALGGFDETFAPYYWEDLDLSYRARKRGWRVGYEPRAQVRHEISATTRRHAGAFRRAAIIERNRLWFHWKNLDRETLGEHLGWAAALLVQKALRRELSYHFGFGLALAGLPGLVRQRRRERAWWRRRDAELAIPVGEDIIQSAGNNPASGVPLQ